MRPSSWCLQWVRAGCTGRQYPSWRESGTPEGGAEAQWKEHRQEVCGVQAGKRQGVGSVGTWDGRSGGGRRSEEQSTAKNSAAGRQESVAHLKLKRRRPVEICRLLDALELLPSGRFEDMGGRRVARCVWNVQILVFVVRCFTTTAAPSRVRVTARCAFRVNRPLALQSRRHDAG